jgi:hypothetical protein
MVNGMSEIELGGDSRRDKTLQVPVPYSLLGQRKILKN